MPQKSVTNPKPVVAKICYEPNLPANVQFFATDQLVGHGSQKARFSRLAPPLPPAPPSSALRINNSVGKKCDLLILAAADETAVEHFSQARSLAVRPQRREESSTCTGRCSSTNLEVVQVAHNFEIRRLASLHCFRGGTRSPRRSCRASCAGPRSTSP